jgi:hypothetical protein
MFRHRNKLVHVAAAVVLLAMSAALWPSMGASATHASSAIYALASPTAVCPTPGNNACITNTPTAGVTLNGLNQTVSYNLLFTLSNSTPGNWHVTITSTQFAAGSHTLPTNASNVTGVITVPNCTGNTCPSNMITYSVPVPVPAGSPAPTPNTFYDNSTGSSTHGVGTFNLQATIQVAVPANAYAVNYTSTITIAFVSGSP